jgi:hypothetical protein
MGRFCDAPEIVSRIDKAKDGKLTRVEMLNFFRQDTRREDFHKIATHHVSEWADQNDWQVALNRSKDFAELPDPQKRRLFKDQIQPVLWWTDDIESAAGLPSDKLVWSYHPITFFVWLHDRLRNAQASKDIGSAADFKGTTAPANFGDDSGSDEGFADEEDALGSGKKLELEDLSKGYPDEK